MGRRWNPTRSLEGLDERDRSVPLAFGFLVVVEESPDDFDVRIEPNAGEHAHQYNLLGVFVGGVWATDGDEYPFAFGGAFGRVEAD